jgi:hypothetical protein
MTEREIIIAVARSLYWGYGKDTTGTPGNLSDLNAAERKIWTAAGKRAVKKIEQLSSQQPTNGAGAKPVNGIAVKRANGIAAKPKVASKLNGRDTRPPAKIKPALSASAR